MNIGSLKKSVSQLLVEWYEEFRPASGAEPERYVVCAGLAVLEQVRKHFPLEAHHYITNRNQVKTSGALIKTILARHNEERTYSREGGRTTRGTRTAAESLVNRLNTIIEIGALSDSKRAELIDELQQWLAKRATEYFNRQRIQVEINLEKPGLFIVRDLLLAAIARKQGGQVAQHLVGAKLCLRFPHIKIENHSFTTADVQTGRGGDFSVRDTIFHVTMAPVPAVIEKCGINIRNGYRSILLVPEEKMAAARQNAEIYEFGEKIGIYSIEYFVGQNIEEMGEFEKAKLAEEFRTLLHTYNERVAAVETDLSILIEIPENL
jgi:hypothetical protein